MSDVFKRRLAAKAAAEDVERAAMLSVCAKEAERARISAQISAFLAAGGAIEQVGTEVVTVDMVKARSALGEANGLTMADGRHAWREPVVNEPKRKNDK